ncbi:MULTISPECIES: NUDIX hydrolase YfcD [Rahnella]|jgi:8-oxo-dGTP pyrophosphatase MutT (NUDIX family)|uniref:NUDIX hydrolase YfcD n=1 Tax=Rahnella sp. (strain Y9602) TaxID=2703885 RepID=A0ABW6CCJ4_RAHSY|nr:MULTISPECIES: NUDIX hydrolase YfcD [Rahnella]AZP41433.1 NUDIX hydrolase YfcD [Rahnella aquatilis]AZP45774.1 NUDIX hydrolase YfcD [Rahnella aquatilis]MBU9865106.1 NUDIX hydrolase YfcD [Rahnella aceris]NIA86969.1 NUDIX hydrolase YfcD [Rahnella aceris]QQN35208.1 NUDIX hydrolase YfcD [Rahnella aceris]
MSEQEQNISTDEWVDIVNEDNEVIAQASRQQMRAQVLRHRASYIVVHDGMGNILVQRRTETKDFYPGWLDATAGGVVQSGENILDSARREAEEELGIAGVPFAEHGQFYFEEENKCRVWGALFSCVSHGPFALQEEEIDAVRWMTPEEITARCDEFTPDSLKALSLWMTRNNEKEHGKPLTREAAAPVADASVPGNKENDEEESSAKDDI